MQGDGQDLGAGVAGEAIGGTPGGVQSKSDVHDHVSMKADSFLDLLSARAEHFPGCVFRGHADANWELRPSATRDPDAFVPYGGPSGLSHWSPRGHALNDLLEAFQLELNRGGHRLPTEAPTVKPMASRGHTGAGPWTPAFPLMALAQHHGLPTLFLDWTARAWVAAYFAALEAARGIETSCHWLAVWVLDVSRLGEHESRDLLYHPPGETNPNLRAQAGLFTRHDQADALEDVLTENWPNMTSLKRILLPHTEARRLLRLLALEGISGATMFPGADGVVRSLRERTLWGE